MEVGKPWRASTPALGSSGSVAEDCTAVQSEISSNSGSSHDVHQSPVRTSSTSLDDNITSSRFSPKNCQDELSSGVPGDEVPVHSEADTSDTDTTNFKPQTGKGNNMSEEEENLNCSSVSLNESENGFGLFEGPIGYGGDTYTCFACSEEFNDRLGLDLHQKEKHKTWCKICRKCLSSKRSFEEHMMRHIRYPCLHCTKEFRYQQEVEEHQMKHFKNKNLRCDLCGLEFYLQSSFNTHHMGVNCVELQKNIQAIEDKQRRLERQPTKCTKCFVMIPKNEMAAHLKKHMKGTAKKVKMHTCPLCYLDYTQRHNLVSHMRRYHPGVSPPRTVTLWLADGDPLPPGYESKK